MRCNVTGNILARGEFPKADISLSVKSGNTVVSGMGVNLEPFNAGLSLSGEGPCF